MSYTHYLWSHPRACARGCNAFAEPLSEDEARAYVRERQDSSPPGWHFRLPGDEAPKDMD